MKPETTEIKTDLLIVGGGIAGINAAMAAREAGMQVTIIDKAGIIRSGNLGAGVDHFNAFLEEGEPWDTEEAWLAYAGRVLKGAIDLKVHQAIFCKELKPAITRMARIGNRLDDPATRKFFRTQAFGQPGPLTINFKGKEFKVNLAKEARRIGCQIIEKAMVTRLLLSNGQARLLPTDREGGQVAGACAFDIRTGRFYLIRAKAVILATGIAARIFENPSGFAFNTWQSPYNSGDAQAMAYKAGAELSNMEYLGLTVVPKSFSAAGLNALMGMGCYLINAAGERFMTRYHPQGERAPRYKIVEGVLTEAREGRGPVYADGRHLSAKDIEHLKATLSWDKDTFTDYLAQKGIDLAKEPMEVMVSEGMQRAPELLSSGIRIDERCTSSLPGLYAGGDSTDQARALSPSITSGYVAGREAAASLKGIKEYLPIRQEEVREEEERIMAPLSRKRGVAYTEFEDIIRKIMSEQVGVARTEPGLRVGLAKLQRLESIKKELMARDYHELMRVAEAQNLLTCAQMMAHAALFRQESRFGLSHNRVDYPATDDENWCGLVVVKRKEEDTQVSFKPLKY